MKYYIFIIFWMLSVSQKAISQNAYEYIYSDIVYRIYTSEKDNISENDTIYFLTNSKFVSYKVNIDKIGKLNQHPADNRIKGNHIDNVYSLGAPNVRRKRITITVSCYGASYKEGCLRYYLGGWLVFKYFYNSKKRKYEFSSIENYGI